MHNSTIHIELCDGSERPVIDERKNFSISVHLIIVIGFDQDTDKLPFGASNQPVPFRENSSNDNDARLPNQNLPFTAGL